MSWTCSLVTRLATSRLAVAIITPKYIPPSNLSPVTLQASIRPLDNQEESYETLDPHRYTIGHFGQLCC